MFNDRENSLTSKVKLHWILAFTDSINLREHSEDSEWELDREGMWPMLHVDEEVKEFIIGLSIGASETRSWVKELS